MGAGVGVGVGVGAGAGADPSVSAYLPSLQPFSDFPDILRLHASNGTPGIVFGGPYESDTAVVDMVDCMSYALEAQMKVELENARAITVLVDESTDRGRSHNLAVYVSYVGPGFRVYCRFLKLVQLGSNCDAGALESKLLDALKVRECPGWGHNGATIGLRVV